VDREAALTLLPAVTELFCHPLLDAGSGVEEAEPLGFYRIHAKAMTDRRNHAKQGTLIARAAHSVADRLLQLAEQPPAWAKSAGQMRTLSARYRAEALAKESEVVIEQARWAAFLPTYARMCGQLIRARERLQYKHTRIFGRFIVRGLGLRRSPVLS
jgi:citrate synthase